jgi:hypothetical protein
MSADNYERNFFAENVDAAFDQQTLASLYVDMQEIDARNIVGEVTESDHRQFDVFSSIEGGSVFLCLAAENRLEAPIIVSGILLRECRRPGCGMGDTVHERVFTRYHAVRRKRRFRELHMMPVALNADQPNAKSFSLCTKTSNVHPAPPTEFDHRESAFRKINGPQGSGELSGVGVPVRWQGIDFDQRDAVTHDLR